MLPLARRRHGLGGRRRSLASLVPAAARPDPAGSRPYLSDFLISTHTERHIQQSREVKAHAGYPEAQTQP